MAQSSIEKILAERAPRAEQGEEIADGDRFFGIIRGEGINEDFLEFQLSNGNQVCFAYGDLSWFNFDPKQGCIDLDFGCAVVTINGRGLTPRLWEGIKGKRVAWIKEKDSEMQDHQGNESFIESILIAPAGVAADEEEKS